MFNKLKGWWRGRPLSYEEELSFALDYCSTRRFASLPPEQQTVGLLALADGIAKFAGDLDEGNADV